MFSGGQPPFDHKKPPGSRDSETPRYIIGCVLVLAGLTVASILFWLVQGL